MATFPLADLLTGVKSIGVRLKGKKSDNSLEDIKTNDNGALKVDGAVTLTGRKVTDITFHDAVTVAGVGTEFTVGGYKTLTVEIFGTSTSRQITFIGRGPANYGRIISGVNLKDISVATSTTGNNELWQFDITGLLSISMNLESVAGGNVSVKGKAVA